MEQDLKLRVIEDSIRARYGDNKEDIITYFMALQHQNFVLCNSITNLVKSWPPPPPPIPTDHPTTNEVAQMFGILLETKD